MRGLVALATVLLTTIDAAFAAGFPTAPAPLIGIGLPIAGGVLAAVWLARRWRRRD